MTDELREKYKYPELTDEIKDQIFGLNAAKLFGIDIKAKRQAIKADKLTRLREEYRRDPSPSNTQYGWVWVGEGQPTAPVGGSALTRPSSVLSGRTPASSPTGSA